MRINQYDHQLSANLSLFEGSLWRDNEILRHDYAFGHGRIGTVSQFKATLRHGHFTRVGCYPVHLVTDDGEALCFSCAADNARNIMESIRNGINDGWRVIASQVNWEDDDCYCGHCGTKLDSAYVS